LSDETLFRAIKAQFSPLEALGFKRGMMNKVILSCGGAVLDNFSESIQTGRLRRKGKCVDTYGNPKQREIWEYFITKPGGLVERPLDGRKSLVPLATS
jgi:hypothetical protein